MPLLVAVPWLPASKTMVPLTFCTLRAWMMPVLLTALASTASRAPADNNTVPPSAWIRPPLPDRLSSVLWFTRKLTRLLPAKESVTSLPAARAVVPAVVAMLP